MRLFSTLDLPMIEQTAMANGSDFLVLVASEFYEIPVGQVTREQRRAMKEVCFHYLYGGQRQRLTGLRTSSVSVQD